MLLATASRLSLRQASALDELRTPSDYRMAVSIVRSSTEYSLWLLTMSSPLGSLSLQAPYQCAYTFLRCNVHCVSAAHSPSRLICPWLSRLRGSQVAQVCAAGKCASRWNDVLSVSSSFY